VWQDFWLANPVDGPNPYDPEMFIDNTEEFTELAQWINYNGYRGMFEGRSL